MRARNEFNCRHEDINIKTGQARYSRSLWFVTISEQIKDTPLSLALQGETVDVADIPAWQRVNTFSPGVRHSPHYIFHGALHQAHEMEMVGSMLGLTVERKREIARAILTAWQKSGCYRGADEYIQNLMREGGPNSSARKAGAPPAVKATVVLDEAKVLAIAREAIAAKDTWVDRAEFDTPKRNPDGSWNVLVWRLPKVPGGHRLITIDKEGRVKDYFRGR